AGVAYKLACALAKKTLRERFIQLAGIATVADIVPLTDENRSIVKLALKEINENPTKGISALIDCAGIKLPCTSSDIAFYIAPRINAAGRMEDAYCCVELLTTRDDARAGEIAAHLNTLNAKRQAICGDIYESALEKLKDLKPGQYQRAIILADSSWKHSVIGITASKLAEKFNRPVILFEEKDGILTGSARSIPGIDIMTILNRVQTLLSRFGGHEQAAGITMPAECFDEFVGRINEIMAEQDDEVFIPVCDYDAQVCLADITVKLAEEISLLEPFGHKNPEPCYLISRARVEDFRYIGKDGSHIRFRINDGTYFSDMTAFGKACWWDSILNRDALDAIVSLGTWNGRVQLTARSISQINDENMIIKGISSNFFQIYNAFFTQSLYNIKTSFIDKNVLYTDNMVDLITECAERTSRGLLVLVFHPKRCEELIGLLPEKACKAFAISMHYTLEDSGVNSIVFGAYLDKVCWHYYEKVFIFDNTDEVDISYILRHAPSSCAVYLTKRSGQRIKYPFDFSRETMKGYYIKLREMISATCDDACRQLQRAYPDNDICGARVALDVFRELGFIDIVNGKLVMLEQSKRDLNESEAYRAIISLSENKEGKNAANR
ncbi:MAG TPA: DHHA1 domain-containing protein, partial [Clostridia bacterium]|nr:DHHA1 domain-containing protein [Clostridia bacterium]